MPHSEESEDWDVWLRALDDCKYYHLSDILYYRLDADKDQKPRINRELIGPRDNARIYMRHGFRHLGFLNCSKLIIRLYIRALYRIALISIGQHKRFHAGKSSTLTSETKAIAEQGLREILSTKVPGIDL